MTHDPRGTIELLRDHLATHDKPLTFLFGAGVSAAVNIAPPPTPGARRNYVPLIPATDGLTGECEAEASKLGAKFAGAWRAIQEECDALTLLKNIENILSRLQYKLDALGAKDKPLGLSKTELEGLEICIRRTIAKCVTPDPSRMPKRLPHDDFAFWIRHASRKYPLEIFTTNYDVLIERSLEYARIPVFDGFAGSHEPFFAPEWVEDDSHLPGPQWVRLWKIHGSVNWRKVKHSTGGRIVRGPVSTEGEMILPSHRKYDESRKQPFQSLLDRLGRRLMQRGALLITVGFSFSDEHINAVILSALENRPLTHVVSLQFSPIQEGDHLVRHAVAFPNLIVLGPNAAAIGGEFGLWRLADPVDAKTCGFMDGPFDSDAAIGDGNAPLTGRVRLGDFNCFSRFLRGMATQAKEDR
jgi:hypothetical protein